MSSAVIPRFIGQLLNGKSPVINGDGSFSRDFTYIDDTVDAYIKSINFNLITNLIKI